MKKIYSILVLITLSLTALAQGGSELYSKYSDRPGMEAVYISPAMFRMIGKIPDVELGDEDINFSSIIKSMTGFFILSTENSEHAAALLDDVNKFIKAGKYELLMEAKDDGDSAWMFSAGDAKTITSFMMLSQEGDEISVIFFEGNMDREQFGEMVAKSAGKK